MVFLLKLKQLFFEGHERSVKANKNILYSFGIKGISIVSQFALVPLTLHYLDPTRYGIWLTLASVMSWFSFFDIGVGHGLRNKLAEAVANGQTIKARKLVSTAYALVTIIFLGLMVIFWVINPFLNWEVILNTPAGMGDELRSILLFVFSFFCLRFILTLIGNVLLAKQEPALNNLIFPLSNVFSLLVIYLLTLTTTGSLFNVAVTFSILPVVVLLGFTLFFFLGRFKEIAPRFSYIDMRYRRSLLGLGVQYFIIQMAAVIIFTTSNFIIVQLFGPAEVTAYNISYKYFSIVVMFYAIIISPFWSAITEAYVKKDFAWIRKTIRNLEYIGIAFTILSIILLLISNTLYEWWVGEEIQIPWSLSMTMCVYVIISVLSTPYVTFINGTSKIRLQLYSAVLTIILTIPLAIWFASGLGMGPSGVVLATICTTFPTMILWRIQYMKIINNNAKGIWAK